GRVERRRLGAVGEGRRVQYDRCSGANADQLDILHLRVRLPDHREQVRHPLTQEWSIQVQRQERLLELDPEHGRLSRYRSGFPEAPQIDREYPPTGPGELLHGAARSGGRDQSFIAGVDDHRGVSGIFSGVSMTDGITTPRFGRNANLVMSHPDRATGPTFVTWKSGNVSGSAITCRTSFLNSSSVRFNSARFFVSSVAAAAFR